MQRGQVLLARGGKLLEASDLGVALGQEIGVELIGCGAAAREGVDQDVEALVLRFQIGETEVERGQLGVTEVDFGL